MKELKETTLKISMESQKILKNQHNVMMENKAWGVTIPYFKL